MQTNKNAPMASLDALFTLFTPQSCLALFNKDNSSMFLSNETNEKEMSLYVPNKIK